MKFKVTKRQIIKALKTEPLLPGSFVHDEHDYDDGNNSRFKNNIKCPVCAVGAILDCSIGNKVEGPKELDEIGHIITMKSGFWSTFGTKTAISAAKDMVDENPLSALSCLFESLMENSDMQTKKGFANAKARNILVNFVRKNFPSKLHLDTNCEY